MSRASRWFLSLLFSCLALPVAWAGTVTVYTSLDEDEIPSYVAGAKKAMPDIDLKVLRLSTGDLAARIMAEAANPQNDVIWAWALTNMLDPRILALLEPYQPAAAKNLAPQFRAKDGKWFAITGYMEAFCVNTERLKAKGLPMPKDWEDLADPRFKGEVLMPSPVSSGTGYVQISALLQRMGEQKGWAFLKALDANVAQYTKSGSAPCKRTALGEFTVGASLVLAATQSIKEGYPLKMVIPAHGAGHEIGASALMAGAKNKADAKRVLDWMVSPDAAALYGKFKEIVTIPGHKLSAELLQAGLPADITKALYPVDFEKSTSQKAAITEQWRKSFNR